MKESLLYIASPGLGENIAATPAMDYLSNKFDIILAINKSYEFFFKNYSFLTRLVLIHNNSLFLEELIDKNDGKEYSWQTSHLDKMLNVFNLNIPRLIKSTFYGLPLSSGEDTLKSFGCDITQFNVKKRCPTKIKKDNVPRIILYIGSKENIRRLPIAQYNSLLFKLNEKYGKDYEIIALYDKPTFGVYSVGRHIIADNDPQALLNLFESGANIMIGPDSGLTHVALSYDIPQLYFEGRDRIESVHSKVYFPIIHMYKKLNSVCERNCKSFTHIKKYGCFPPRESVLPLAGATLFKDLQCRSLINSPCLSFDEEDEKHIFSMLADILNKK